MANEIYAPKIIVPVLEIPLAEHCNLKCTGCSHHSPYLKPHFYELNQYMEDINALKNVFHTTKLVFLGGEPLLNKQIKKYILYAKQARIADSYSIITNGLLLMTMDDDFFQLIDQINVSLYPNTGLNEKILRAFLEEKSVESKFIYNIRQFKYFQNIETEKLSDNNAQDNFIKCCKQKTCHYLYEGHYYKCNRPVTTKQFLEHKNNAMPVPAFKVRDGICIAEPNLYSRLQDYVNCKERLLACYYCLHGYIEKNTIDNIISRLANNKFIRRAVINNKRLYGICMKIEKINIKHKESTLEQKSNSIVTEFEHRQLDR